MYEQNYEHHRMMDPHQMHYSHDHQYVQHQMYNQQQYVEPTYQMQPPLQIHSPHQVHQNQQSHHNSPQQSVIVNNPYQSYQEYNVAVPQESQEQVYENYQVLAQGGEVDTDCLIIEEQEESSCDGEEYEENSDDQTTVEVPINTKVIDENDFDEQIEASTISFCSTTNGTSTNKRITIKFRKEKAEAPFAGGNSESNSRSSSPTPNYHEQFTPTTTIGKKKKKSKYRSNYDSENATFMPSNNNSCSSSQYVSNRDDEQANGEDAELLLSFSTIKAKDNRKMQKANMVSLFYQMS